MNVKNTIKKHPIVTGVVAVVAAVKASKWLDEKHGTGPIAWWNKAKASMAEPKA